MSNLTPPGRSATTSNGMAMTRIKRSKDELEKAYKHVEFELLMLQATARLIQKPSLVEAADRAHLASFAIHMRNLIESADRLCQQSFGRCPRQNDSDRPVVGGCAVQHGQDAIDADCGEHVKKRFGSFSLRRARPRRVRTRPRHASQFLGAELSGHASRSATPDIQSLILNQGQWTRHWDLQYQVAVRTLSKRESFFR